MHPVFHPVFCTFRASFFALLLLSLTGCKRTAGDYYPLDTPVIFQKEEKGIAVKIRSIPTSQQYSFFGKNLTDDNILPFQLSIENKSKHTFAVRPSYISVSTLHRSTILDSCMYTTGQRTGILTGTFLGSAIYFWPGILLFCLPLRYYMLSTNERLQRQIERTILDEDSMTIDILPYERIERFFFCDLRTYKGTMEFCVLNRDSKEYVKFPTWVLPAE